MSDDIVARLRGHHCKTWPDPKCNLDGLCQCAFENKAADLIEQQAARIKELERDAERYRSLIDATEINADSFTWRRKEKAKSATIVAEMDAIFGMTEE